MHENGDIESIDHIRKRKNGRLDNRKGKILKPGIDSDGYLKVTLTNNGTRKSYLVHRLVALAFLPNPESKPTVNHKNGIKTDNRVNNLEWATNKEQKIHAIKNNLCNQNIEELKQANIKRSIKIIYDGVKYNSIREASRRTGICQWSIKRKGKEVMPNE